MSKVVWLVTYPRSGSTWLRLMLANVQFPDREIGYRDIDNLLPDAHQRPWRDVVGKKSLSPVFVKSHWDLAPEYFDYPVALYNYRDPRDVAISRYWFERQKGRLSEKDRFSDWLYACFIPGKIGYGSWLRHVDMWTGKQLSFMIHFVKYENLVANPSDVLKQICEFSGIAVENGTVRCAVKNCEWEKLKKRAAIDGVHPWARGRTGKAGGWKQVFTDEMNARVWDWAGEVMARLGYSKEA